MRLKIASRRQKTGLSFTPSPFKSHLLDLTKRKKQPKGCFFAWRRRWDLNPCAAHTAYSLSRGAPSPLGYFSMVKITFLYHASARRISSKAMVRNGGERGIRTPGPCGSLVFKTSSINHSDISPCLKRLIILSYRGENVNRFIYFPKMI